MTPTPAMIVSVVLTAYLAGEPATGAKDTAPSCELTTAEIRKALDVVHAAPRRLRGRCQTRRRRMAAPHHRGPCAGRLCTHGLVAPGVDLGIQLTRLKRTEEARRLFSRIHELDPDGDWGTKAAGHLKKIAEAR